MQKAGSGFTFVELIIVLVIIAILSTIGFVSYESYLSVWRDTAKISLMRDINTSFGTYSLKSKIPLPENKVDITASWTVFAYQWDFTESIANTIGFRWNPYDTSLDIYPTYMLWANRKDTQILHFLEDRQSTQISSVIETYAFTDYQILYPKIIGQALGIMLDSETQQPLHRIDNFSTLGNYDVVNGTWALRAYYSQQEYYEEDLQKIIPDNNCKRILELWSSKGDGIYTVTKLDGKKTNVYCDMTRNGWGWMLIAFSAPNWKTSGDNFGWLYQTWNPSDYSNAYSLWGDIRDIYFSSILFTAYDGNIVDDVISHKWIMDGIDREIVASESSLQVPTWYSSCVNVASYSTWPCYNQWGRIWETNSYFFYNHQTNTASSWNFWLWDEEFIWWTNAASVRYKQGTLHVQ